MHVLIRVTTNLIDMKNYLVLYYSKTGNSQFLAKEVARILHADCHKVVPVVNGLFLLLLFSLMKIKVATKPGKELLLAYDEIILFGPIWTGQLISPLRSMLAKCAKANRPIHFGLSCVTGDQEKGDKYGYESVVKVAKEIGGRWVKSTCAFPAPLLKIDDPTWDPKHPGKVTITKENFKGPFKQRLEDFATAIKENAVMTASKSA